MVGQMCSHVDVGLGWCCWHFVKRVRVPAASEVPVRGSRRRLTPECCRDVASLVLDWGPRSCLCPGIEDWEESVVGRWVTLEREAHQAMREGRPDPREMEAEITALRRRVRELEKENECVGNASAFFASAHHNTSAVN